MARVRSTSESGSAAPQTSVSSIIKYGEPKCKSSAAPARYSIFTHPRELADPSTHQLIRKMARHGLPRNLVESKSPRRHSEIVVSSEEMMQHLNEICAPKEWTENSMYFVQTLCKEPSSREETIVLGKHIDSLLESRRAKQSGICSIRREIFSQLFDELLRQVSTENLLWGKLLLRIRNEINMTLEAYAALFSNSMSFGRARFLETTAHLPKHRERRSQLKEEIDTLREELEVAKREVYEREKVAERMQNNRELVEKFDRDKRMKVRQSFFVALDNIEPITVSFVSGDSAQNGPGVEKTEEGVSSAGVEVKQQDTSVNRSVKEEVDFSFLGSKEGRSSELPENMYSSVMPANSDLHASQQSTVPLNSTRSKSSLIKKNNSTTKAEV